MHKPTSQSARQLEQRIQDDAWARKGLDTLVAGGAKRDELWSCLQALESSQLLGFASWNQRSRFTKRQAKTLAGKLNTDADSIRAFFAPDLYWYLTEDRQFRWIVLLQKHLKRMAGLIEELSRTSDDRGADDARAAKLRFTEYVREATGKPHDREMADLIRVTLCLPIGYSAEEQRKFRTRLTKTGRI